MFQEFTYNKSLYQKLQSNFKIEQISLHIYTVSALNTMMMVDTNLKGKYIKGKYLKRNSLSFSKYLDKVTSSLQYTLCLPYLILSPWFEPNKSGTKGYVHLVMTSLLHEQKEECIFHREEGK